jgi:tripartite-type tricarboxylate transporter receptor subunit TctC
MKRTLGILAGFGALALTAAAAMAQSYPTKPIQFVIGFAPGGPSDVMSRIIVDKLGQVLGQPVIVDNRPGAGGSIAGQAVSRAAPDGYTLLLATNGILATNQYIYKDIGYNPLTAFEPITLIGRQPNVIYVNPKVLINTFEEYVEFARKNPGKLNFGSGGIATSSHLAGELLKVQAKIDITHVPFKGTGPVLQAVITGDIQSGMNPPPPLMPHINSKAIRALAVTSLKRTAALPDLPTVAERGYPGFDATAWHSVVVPTGTPKAIVERLHKALMETLKDPRVNKQLTDLGVDIEPMQPDQFRAFIKSEGPRWKGIVEAAGIKRQ